MTTDVEQSYCGGWLGEESSDGDDHQEIPVSEMHDRGSVSFGRFSVESLSWERKSVFGHDRRQEELEKFNGLVAKKKAYFEERYRRMRALKAKQPNQQTELVLDYGAGDGSNSSQSGEEDGTDSKFAGHREDGPASIDYTPSGEYAKSEGLVEKESSCTGSQQAHKPDHESSLSGLSSSQEKLENVAQSRSHSGIMHLESATMGSSSRTRENVEEDEQNHSNSPESPEISGKPEVAVAKMSGLKRESAQVNQLPSVKKSQGRRSVPKTKDSVTGIRSGPGLKRETKSDVAKPSKGVTIPLRHTVGKVENSHLARSANLSKVENNNRTTTLASKRSILDARTDRSNLSTKGAFSLATEKRANLRGSEVKQDSRIPNKVVSSLSHTKGALVIQDKSSKKTTTIPTIKNTQGTESKRGSKEGKMKPPESDSQTKFKRTEQSLHVQKSRSVNLPARNKSGSTAGVTLHPRVTKRTEKKEVEETGSTVTRELRGVATKSSTYLKATATKKAQQSYSARKQQLGNVSLDRRKTKDTSPLSRS